MTTELWQKMHKRPKPGQRITVRFSDGSKKSCHATRIVSDAGTYIMIYHKGTAIDEDSAVGWRPR